MLSSGAFSPTVNATFCRAYGTPNGASGLALANASALCFAILALCMFSSIIGLSAYVLLPEAS